jgi:hypothetical protein
MTTQMVDLFDLLQPVRAHGSSEAHLAPRNWAEPPQDTTLCGLQVQGRATQPLDNSACLRCAFRAVGAGIYGVRESDSAVVNLSRLIERQMPDWAARLMKPLPARRRHLASSPLKPEPEPVIERFEAGDLVSHDSYGMGRVVGTEANAVFIDIRTQTVRITSPYSKMTVVGQFEPCGFC